MIKRNRYANMLTISVKSQFLSLSNITSGTASGIAPLRATREITIPLYLKSY